MLRPSEVYNRLFVSYTYTHFEVFRVLRNYPKEDRHIFYILLKCTQNFEPLCYLVSWLAYSLHNPFFKTIIFHSTTVVVGKVFPPFVCLFFT